MCQATGGPKTPTLTKVCLQQRRARQAPALWRRSAETGPVLEVLWVKVLCTLLSSVLRGGRRRMVVIG